MFFSQEYTSCPRQVVHYYQANTNSLDYPHGKHASLAGIDPITVIQQVPSCHRDFHATIRTVRWSVPTVQGTLRQASC